MKALVITSMEDTLNSIRPEAETFIGLQRAGVTMEVMTQAGTPYVDRMAAAGIEVIDFAPRKKFDRHAVRRIREHLVAGGHDVLHLFNNRAISNGVRAARGLAVKVITYRGQTGNIRRFDPTCWLTHLNPRVDRIICVANAVRDDLRQHVRRPDHVVTVYKGHDLGWYRDEPADLVPLGVPRGVFVVCSVANYRPRKGIEVLIDSARHLPRGAPVHFVLVGGDMDAPAVEERLADHPLRENFHRLGFRDDACAIVAASDVSVLASTKREGLPKTVIESMVYEVPPVVSDTGGSGELVVDGDCGFVVPPGEPVALAKAIQYLWEHPAERRAMGRKARARIDTHFNIRDTIDGTLAVYRDVTGRCRW